jgi:hypothetical protein
VNEDRRQAAQRALKEFGIPAVAGVVAAGAGVVLRHKPDVRSVVPDAKTGVRDVMDDLRGKVEAVVRRGDATVENSGPQSRDTNKWDELAERRRAREQRRNQRRSQSGR